MLKKQISAGYLLIAPVAGVALTFAALKFSERKETEIIVKAAQPVKEDCDFTLGRMDGHKYIQPLVSAASECESIRFTALKEQIYHLMSGESANGLETASVYLEDLDNGTWMQLNPKEQFHPASMIKVVTLIAYMKLLEAQPRLLDKKVQLASMDGLPIPMQTYPSKTIEAGKIYTIRELLVAMIAHSDNYATWLLNNNMDMETFKNVFTELGMERPNIGDHDFKMSAAAYSKFMKALYNASYLSIPASEYATSLLCQSDFGEGIVKELPHTVRVAHKFGEAGSNGVHELHESAIIYLEGRAYLLTIMTRGSDVTKLAGTLSHISKLAYDFMSLKT
jgi:beta-lactamase class A